MVKRAEASRGSRTTKAVGPRWFDIDRAWWWRALLVAVAMGLLLLIAKVAMMAFDGLGKRLDRNDPGAAAARAKSRDGP